MKKILALSALLLALAMGSTVLAKPDESQHSLPPRIQEKLDQLPKAKQELVKKAFKEGQEQRQTTREEEKKLAGEIKAILAAPEFDKAAFIEKSNQREALRAKQRTTMTERVADLAGKFTPEERKVLADLFNKSGRGMHKGKPREKSEGTL